MPSSYTFSPTELPSIYAPQVPLSNPQPLPKLQPPVKNHGKPMSILKKNFSPKGITLSALLQKNSANPWNHWSHDRLTLLFRTPDWIADEVPVALVYNGISHAVMMATPSLLEEFALGFSLTEGIINTPKDIYSIQVTEGCRGGKNVDVTIAAGCFWHLKERRRSLIGRTGCGLCGVESLSQAVHTAPNAFPSHTIKKRLPPLVRKLPNLPPRVGGASFALGMMLSHLAKSCDTTVLSCLSFQSHAFLLSRKHCRYMIDSPLGFFWNLSNPTFLSSSPAEKSHQYTQTIQAPTLLRVNIFQISWTVT